MQSGGIWIVETPKLQDESRRTSQCLLVYDDSINDIL